MTRAGLRARLELALVATVTSVTVACGGEPEPDALAVSFRAVTREGEPLAGVHVSAGGRSLGATAVDGLLATRVSGAEGDPVAVTTECPDGYRLARGPERVTLRRLEALSESASPVVSHGIVCEQVKVTSVIVLRVEPRRALTVLVNGERAGTTDENGIEHVVYEAERGTSLQVAFDTRAAPELQPQNPVRTFELGELDSIFLFEQQFREERPGPDRARAHITVRASSRRRGPYRLD